MMGMTVSISLEGIERQARMLSPDERARLVNVLLESLRETPAGEIEAAGKREIAERVAAYDRGEVQMYRVKICFTEARRIAR
jgi:putative addiction module component (TIGR02574 family)